MRRIRKPGSSDRGQSLVEFVLILPILLVLIFGIIEFANAWRTSQIITNAAREVVRQSILYGEGIQSQAAAADTVVARLNDEGLRGDSATVSFPQWCDAPVNPAACTGKPDELTIQYPFTFQFFGPVMRLMCGTGCSSRFGRIELSTTAVMRNE